MGPSIWQLVIVLVIILLLFGTKKLRNVGADLGSAIKSFRGAVKDGGNAAAQAGEPNKIEETKSAEVRADDPLPKARAATDQAKDPADV